MYGLETLRPGSSALGLLQPQAFGRVSKYRRSLGLVVYMGVYIPVYITKGCIFQ